MCIAISVSVSEAFPSSWDVRLRMPHRLSAFRSEVKTTNTQATMTVVTLIVLEMAISPDVAIVATAFAAREAKREKANTRPNSQKASIPFLKHILQRTTTMKEVNSSREIATSITPTSGYEAEASMANNNPAMAQGSDMLYRSCKSVFLPKCAIRASTMAAAANVPIAMARALWLSGSRFNESLKAKVNTLKRAIGRHGNRHS